MSTVPARITVQSNTRTANAAETHSLNALAALAQRTRLKVFRLLVAREPQGMAAGSIALALGAPQNTVSAHLGVLTRANLVIASRQSRNVIYRANLTGMQTLIEYLVSHCCEGQQPGSLSGTVPHCDANAQSA